MPPYSRRRSRYIGSVKNYKPQQTLREAVKDGLMQALYRDSLNHWNNRLQQLAKTNARVNGYTGNFPAGKLGGISYKGKVWAQLNLGWLDENLETAYCFPLDASDPAMLEEMQRIVTEMTELQKEKYESERVLSGLLTQNFDLDDLRGIFGESLYATFCDRLKGACIEHRSKDQAIQDRYRLLSFAERHRPILDRMNERTLINLISTDIFLETSLD